jgi:tetratricopeptide (TPR) repeat protein
MRSIPRQSRHKLSAADAVISLSLQRAAMTTRRSAPHRYSDGQGFGDPSEGFDLGSDRLAPDFEGPIADVDPADDDALADVAEESAIRPSDVEVSALIAVGVEYAAIEQYGQAIDSFARAAHYAPEDSAAAQAAWVNRGVARGEPGEWDEAAGAHREALRIDADDALSAAAETNLAAARCEAGESASPLDHAESAVERDPRLPEAWYNRGYLLNERGQHAAALRCLDVALSLGLRTAWVHDERGGRWRHSGSTNGPPPSRNGRRGAATRTPYGIFESEPSPASYTRLANYISLHPMSVLPADEPTRFDYLLGAMGASLFCAALLGALSAVPLYLAASVGSLVAAGVGVGGTLGEYE